MTYDGRRLMMEDNLRWKTTYDGRRLMMKDDNEDDLKNKEDLHIGGRHTALRYFFNEYLEVRQFLYPSFFCLENSKKFSDIYTNYLQSQGFLILFDIPVGRLCWYLNTCNSPINLTCFCLVRVWLHN